MERIKQDEEYPIEGSTIKMQTKYCLKHKDQLISANNRLQCVECQYEQISKNQQTNFIPLKKLEQLQIDEDCTKQIFNWPLVSKDSRDKLIFYEKLQENAQKSFENIIKIVDEKMQEITQAFEEYKKSSLLFYNEVIEEGNRSVSELTDLDGLRAIKEVLVDANVQDMDKVNESLENIIESKYKQSDSLSNQIKEACEHFEQKLKKFDDFSTELTSRQNKILLFIQTFLKQKKIIQLPDIDMIKSQGRDSNKLNISISQKNQLLIQKQTEFYGWCYSSIILENSFTYEMEFSFDKQPQNYIMIGLIPEEHKDTEPPGQGKNHFCKIFGDSNNYYCGNVEKGDLIEKNIQNDEVIKMKVCIQDNILEFSDNNGNVNSIHSLYNLNNYDQYRICIQFGQKSCNTIRILKFFIDQQNIQQTLQNE